MLQQRIMPTGIKAIIYDIDNCVAPKSNDAITHAWDPALAKEFNLPIRQARYLRKHYFETIGCTLKGFAQQYGRDQKWQDDFYAITGEASGLLFVKRYKSVKRIAKVFAAIHARGVKQLVVTQGHPNHYLHAVRHIGLHPYVPDNGYIDRTHAVYEKLEPHVWENKLNTHGLQPHEVIVLEDTPRNLIQPAALGMHTMLIGNRAHGTAAGSIHYQHPTALKGLTALLPHL